MMALPPLPRAFGPRAELASRRFPSSQSVFCDIGNIGEAYLEIARRRIAGEPFSAMLLWDDPRSRLAWDVAHLLLAQVPQLDDRRAAFDQIAEGTLSLNGVPLSQLTPFEPNLQIFAREFVELGSAQLFWSQNERERFSELFGRRRSRSQVVSAPHVLPAFRPRERDRAGVVIWAPEAAATTTAFLAFAFEEWRGDVSIVCAGGAVPGLRASYVARDDPRVPELLEDAALLVDASLSDPGASLAFAEHGVPLLSASTSGAHEFIRGAVVYDPWRWRSVYAGALRAYGRPTALRGAPFVPPRTVRVSETDWSRSAPLASVVVVTYNRPHELEGALKSVAAQTYPNVQTVVINDGGVSIADVCARFPQLNIKMLDRTENVKHINAYNIGLQAADGEYICGLADDDRLFPDHVERLVDALERSGALVAHSNCLGHYFEIEGGVPREVAFNATAYVDELDATTALAATSVNPTSIMVRRELYARLGYWDPHSKYADYEIQLRWSQVANFVHVDHFTNTWVLRDDDSNMASEKASGEVGAEALRYVYDKFPIEGRPVVEVHRRAVIDMVRSRPPAKYMIRPTFVLSPESSSS